MIYKAANPNRLVGVYVIMDCLCIFGGLPYRHGYAVPACFDPRPFVPDCKAVDLHFLADAAGLCERWTWKFQSALRRHGLLPRFQSCTQPIRRLFAQWYLTYGSLRCCVLPRKLMILKGKICFTKSLKNFLMFTTNLLDICRRRGYNAIIRKGGLLWK